ncbi:MarR family winged helix-turn-helix transcriptional regulator [Streptomyces sp. NPDC094468]|uniref:MarR family winged helix-turn-helix transcriptional regulator n=2 Tax=unclassified Streptomyces TaxID=2593676 RepID=UPI003811CF75
MNDSVPPGTDRPWPSPILPVLGRLHGELRVRHGLTLLGYLVLGALAEAAAGEAPVSVARLTALLGESGTRMSALLGDLQRAGLVERERRAGDRRTVEVTLTDAGRARFAEAERTAQALLGRHPAHGPGPAAPAGAGPPGGHAGDGRRRYGRQTAQSGISQPTHGPVPETRREGT